MRALFLCGFAVLAAVPAWAQIPQDHIADARALVAQEWAGDLLTVDAMISAKQCGIIPAWAIEAVLWKIVAQMSNEQIEAGDIGDPLMQAQQTVHDRRAVAEVQQTPQACERRWHDPAGRAAFRQTVDAYLR